MTKFNCDVIDTARDEAESLVKRIKRAEEIYADLGGNRTSDGLTLSFYGQYVIVDDGADRWLAATDAFQSALDSVLTDCIDEGRYMGDDLGDKAYAALCGECPAIYSNIGAGSLNRDVPMLLKVLGETLDESDVEEVARELNIDLEEVAAAE